ncbi:protein of unknown function [Candidatus Filomicrobium marinum]|uniref:Uncharacterized protein n=1 Tax=Candidatus Filomicrobium marinum TaxID=1608628 RepID=A0A0D6JLP1_9HYPH|nr:protein of unknown function [Candidatus Filomicrobium marinum]CPR22570.1 protein of unknown function [Candidatus Filomicrobium marinum]
MLILTKKFCCAYSSACIRRQVNSLVRNNFPRRVAELLGFFQNLSSGDAAFAKWSVWNSIFFGATPRMSAN